MRSVLVSVAALTLLLAVACSAAGGGAPKASPQPGATTAPSFVPTPTGGKTTDPYGY